MKRRIVRTRHPDFTTEVIFATRWPRASDVGRDCLLIFDRRLDRLVPGFRSWREGFSVSFPVEAGENLKQLSAFVDVIKKVSRLADRVLVGSRGRIVAVGGGSVGDFAGFLASVYRRGTPLIHFPSTWLAALDSSHGGKTALNAAGAKNQIGTFYPAERVYLIEPLLRGQPADRAAEAKGELLKAALLSGRTWVRDLERSKLQDGDLIWRFLPDAIDEKYRVVKRDPFEKTGVRRLLNLGHTFGHVLESHYGLAHGLAVGFGLRFAADWSLKRGLLSTHAHERIEALLCLHHPETKPRSGAFSKPMSKARFIYLASKDKKRTGQGKVRFIFLRGLGRPVQQDVHFKDFYAEARAGGWIKGR